MNKIYSGFMNRTGLKSKTDECSSSPHRWRSTHKFTFTLLLLGVLLSTSFGFAQSAANYAFTAATNGSLENLTTGGTELLAGNKDDSATTVQAIGFDFYFMGVKYTHFSANSNGQVRLHTAATDAAIGGGNISSFSSNTVTLAAMAGDNEVNNGMQMKVVGTAPNRKLVVQWSQFYVQYANITNGGDMQLWLNETSGVISYVYGAIYNSSTSSQTRSVFISSGNTATASGYVTVGDTPTYTVAASPVTNTFAASTVTDGVASPLIANLGSSADGSRVVYSFAPPTVVAGDVTALTFSAVTENTSTVNWTDNATNESGFAVLRATNAAFTQNVVSTSVASTTSAGTGTSYSSIQTGLSAGTTYYYKVIAAVEGGVSTGVTGNQTTLNGATYYWTGATGGMWNTFANWNSAADGSGAAPAAWANSDVLILDGAGTTPGGALAITVDRTSFTVGQIHITSNTNLTLEASTTTTRTITISGGPSADFILAAGSTLNLTSGTKAVAFIFTGSGNEGTIAGIYNASGSTSNAINTTGGTGTLVTVASTGTVVSNLNSTTGGIVGSLTSLLFQNGSNYVHSNSTTSNYFPIAAWEPNATATLNGNTTGTSITSNSTSLGNVVINTTLSTATLSAFASNTRIIQGNLTINSTGTGAGKFRVVTSGFLTINGNFVINGGTVDVASSTGRVLVKGTTTVASGATLDLNQGTLELEGNMVNNGSVLSSETTTVNSKLNMYSPTTAQTISGTGTFTGKISNLSVSNLLGVTISTPVLTQRVNLFRGLITGASNITIGTGGAFSGAVQIGTATNTTAGGSFDVAPTFNLGTGPFTLIYTGESTPRTTGVEVPPSRSITTLIVDNSNGLTLAGGTIEVTDGLTLNSGIVTSSLANHIIHGSATAGGVLTGGSATSYIRGPLVRTVSDLNTGFVLFPVGKSNYSPVSLAPTTTSVSVFKAESFDSNGGTATAAVTNLAANRSWVAQLVSGSFTDVQVRLADALIGSTNIPVQAPTAVGAYTSPFGSTAVYTAGTPNQIESANSVTAANYTGFLSFADANGCLGTPAPGNTIASAATICFGDSVSLSLQNNTAGSGVTYQWKSSTDGVTYTAIPGADGATLSIVPTAATFYLSEVTCDATAATTASTAVQITFTHSVVSSTPAARCGVGTVALAAVPSAGATIKWYTSASGGVAVATGAGFTTPSIAATTTYYAAAEVSSPVVQGTVGTGTSLTSASSNNSVFCNYWATGWRQMVYTAAELTAAGVSAGSITALTFNIATLPDAGTVNNFAIRLGATSNSALTGFTTAGLSTAFGPVNYTPVVGLNSITLTTPYVWDGSSNILIDIREDGQYDNANSQTYYTTTVANTVAYGNASGSVPNASYYTSNPTATLSKLRPNVTFTSQPSCSSARVAVVATVATPPVFSISTSTIDLCNGASSSAVTVTSTVADYDTYTWSPVEGVSGNSATGWIFNPTVTTTYTLTATQTSGSLCAATATVVVTVNPLPSVSVVASALSTCISGDSVKLSTASTSSIIGACLTATAIWPSGTYTPTTLDGVTVNVVTSAAFANEFSNVNVLEGYSYTFTSSVATDYITIGNAAGTIVFAAGPSPVSWTAAADQVIRFYSYTNATCGGESINRTRALTGKLTSAAVWSPTASLFLDAAGTVPYAGTAERTVYAKPTATTMYTVTATTAAGCSATATVSIEAIDCSIPYANLQFPGTATITTCASQTYYAQVYKAGVTELAGQGAGITAWIGRNATNTDPSTWSEASWQLATFNASATGTGNNDEYQATFGPSAAGTYYVASRFKFAPGAFVYGGYEAPPSGGGLWNGTSNVSGVLTVEAVVAPTAADQTFCNSATVADLVATGNGTVFKWYETATGGSALAGTTALANGGLYVSQSVTGCEGPRTMIMITVNVTAAATADAQTFCNSATVADLATTSGTNIQWYAGMTGGSALVGTTALATGTYYVSQTVLGCESARTAVVVTVNVTAAPTAAAQTFCNSATVADLVATSGANLQWYAGMTGGSALASTTALATGTYYVSQTVLGCESTRTAVSVTVNVTAAPTAAAQTFCGSATVANLVGTTGSNLQWYAGMTGGSALASTTALATGTYYVSQTLVGCESARTAVSVTVNVTAAPTAATQTFCGSATVANLVATTGSNLQWYAGMTGGSALVATTALATGTYYVSQTLVGCESARTAVSVTVNVTAAPTAAAQSFCNSATVANLVATTGANLQWYAGMTGGSALASTTALATGTYYVSQTLVGCESARTAVSVTVNVTAAPTGTAIQDFTTGQTLANFTVATAAGGTVTWYSSATGSTVLPSTTVLVSGTTYYASQTVGGCESTARLAVTAGTDLKTPAFELSSLRYYPNPVQDILTVDYSDTIQGVQLYNMLGQLVYNRNTNASKVTIDMASMATGNYILQVTVKGITKNVKVIKK